ncbi:hypothetical protein MGMO_44c00360 [Methyloglobulus morosus KoM1]|uniref:Uncharacterized protein n=1 Tax=Methyloglobulus morosus KoM1 TaxID=1116472 RepID=V5E011_9GAMM|nr:hypothetical protein [Methyloglobulus morosus]ESS72886.1 hypothetical protein MGMO_44c00360 [Methyloglobulus morosus KoM1]
MASLGEQFPSEIKRSHIENALKPGCVVRLELKLTTITKPKFLVLVTTDDPEYLSFLVNSEINTYIQNRPDLLKCQVSIDAANHNFLSYDSHIACHEITTIMREEVVRALMADPAALRGKISTDVREQIMAAVKIAKTIDKDKKNRIISSLENAI